MVSTLPVGPQMLKPSFLLFEQQYPRKGAEDYWRAWAPTERTASHRLRDVVSLQVIAGLAAVSSLGSQRDQGNPYDGHTLGPVIAELEKLTSAAVRRIHGDKGCRGHNYPDRFKVWISGQVRRVTKAIRREMRRRPAVEP